MWPVHTLLPIGDGASASDTLADPTDSSAGAAVTIEPHGIGARHDDSPLEPGDEFPSGVPF